MGRASLASRPVPSRQTASRSRAAHVDDAVRVAAGAELSVAHADGNAADRLIRRGRAEACTRRRRRLARGGRRVARAAGGSGGARRERVAEGLTGGSRTPCPPETLRGAQSVNGDPMVTALPWLRPPHRRNPHAPVDGRMGYLLLTARSRGRSCRACGVRPQAWPAPGAPPKVAGVSPHVL